MKKKIEVCLSPRDFDLYKEGFEIIVVIDVLRATSAICAGIANGVKSIIPVDSIEKALEYKKKGYLVGAERKGQIVEGFDFGNSPYSFMDSKFIGKEIVLTTTNGTKSIQISKESGTIVIGALVNLEALTNWLLKQNLNVLCLCSGWQDKFNLEDSICAGAIAEILISSGKYYSEEDSTICVKHLYNASKKSSFSFLKASSHRKRLRNLNLNKDIKYCLTPNQLDVIPILKNNEIININEKENIF
jgi:2-phosphosulfolactate phosphatase